MKSNLRWAVLASVLLGFAAPRAAEAQPPVVAPPPAIVEGGDDTPPGVPPDIERPNQIGVEFLAKRLGMRLESQPDGDVAVSEVFPNSQAVELGIREGDVLKSIERQAITTLTQVVDIIASDSPEKKVALVFFRDDRPVTATVPLATLLMPAPAPKARPEPAEAPRVSFFGMTAVENADGMVTVAAVAPGSPAALAGIFAGDMLLEIEGREVASLEQLSLVASNLVEAMEPGDRVVVEGVREGSEQTFAMILRKDDFPSVRAPMPVPAPAVAAEPPVRAPVTPRVPIAPRTDANQRVVFCMALRQLASGSIVVTDVMEGSPAATAGIQAGDAIVSIAGEKIGSLEEMASIIAQQKEGDTVEFGVARADKLGSVQVKMLPCEYRRQPAVASEGNAQGITAEVQALRTQVEELSQIVKELAAEVEGLKQR